MPDGAGDAARWPKISAVAARPTSRTAAADASSTTHAIARGGGRATRGSGVELR